MPAEYVVQPSAGQSKPDGAGKVLWGSFRYEVERLAALPVKTEHVGVFYACQNAYRALRDHFVVHRPNPHGKPAFGADPELERWSEELADFRTRFWGKDEGQWIGRGEEKRWKPLRRFAGVPEPVASVMREYQRLWGIWYHKSAYGRLQAVKARERYEATPEGALVNREAKEAYAKSDAGKATAKRAKKAAARRKKIAKGIEQQALYDSWQHEGEPTIEEVLRDV